VVDADGNGCGLGRVLINAQIGAPTWIEERVTLAKRISRDGRVMSVP